MSNKRATQNHIALVLNQEDLSKEKLLIKSQMDEDDESKYKNWMKMDKPPNPNTLEDFKDFLMTTGSDTINYYEEHNNEKFSFTLLQKATKKQEFKFVQLLLQHGVNPNFNPNPKKACLPIIYAFQSGNIDLVTVFLEAEDVDMEFHQKQDGLNILHCFLTSFEPNETHANLFNSLWTNHLLYPSLVKIINDKDPKGCMPLYLSLIHI